MTPILILLTLLAVDAPQWTFETSQAYVNSIYDAGDGTIWFATAGGILHWDPQAGWDDSFLYPEGVPWYRTNDMTFNGETMWIATDGGGLAMEQNGSWTVFTEYEGVPGNGVVHAVHSAGGYIWAGTGGGLSRGGAGGFIPITASETGGVFTGEEVTGISSVGDILLLATDRGIFYYDLSMQLTDPAAWTSFESETINLGLTGIYSVDPDTVLGFGPGGVAIHDGLKWQVLLDYASTSDSVVNGVVVTPDGILAAARKVIRYDGSGWVHEGTGYPPESYASCLAEIDGTIWCGFGLNSCSCRDTGRGPGYLEEGQWVRFAVPGMAAPSCYQIAEDEGRFYIGSHRMGLMAYYPGDGWLSFARYTADMPNALRTYSAAVSAAPGVWTGSYSYGLTWIGDGGTYSTDDDSIITFVSDSLAGLPPSVVQIVSPLLNNQVIMLASQGGGLWVAQEAFWATPEEESGIVGLSGDPVSGGVQWAPRTVSDGLSRKNVQAIFSSGSDSLWIAFASGEGCQLLVHSGDPSDDSADSWYPSPGEAYTTSWGLPSGQVFCFARESSGTIIAGTGNGICRWQGDVFVQIPGVTGPVKSIEVDGSGRIWCLGSDALYCVDGSTVEQYTASNSPFIPTSRVENEFSLFDPVTGSVFFSSTIGLWSVRRGGGGPQSPVPVFYPQPYLPADGLLHMSWSGGGEPVETTIFTVDGSYVGTVTADSSEQWSWDGLIDGEQLATGVYMVLIRSGDDLVRATIAVVR